MNFDKKTIALVLSVLLNVAGGFGIVPPVTGGAACAPASSSGLQAPDVSPSVPDLQSPTP